MAKPEEELAASLHTQLSWVAKHEQELAVAISTTLVRISPSSFQSSEIFHSLNINLATAFFERMQTVTFLPAVLS